MVPPSLAPFIPEKCINATTLFTRDACEKRKVKRTTQKVLAYSIASDEIGLFD